MSISAVSGAATSLLQPASSQQDFRQSFGQLVDALDSGNLSQAQQAYSALSQLGADGQGPAANPNSPFASALNNIGQALQNGDLGAAQQALSSLQQAHGGHHGHHARGAKPPAAPRPAPATDVSAASTNIVDITV
jgi:soluble cytochrome b562